MYLASSPSRLKDLKAARTRVGRRGDVDAEPRGRHQEYIVAYGPAATPLRDAGDGHGRQSDAAGAAGRHARRRQGGQRPRARRLGLGEDRHTVESHGLRGPAAPSAGSAGPACRDAASVARRRAGSILGAGRGHRRRAADAVVDEPRAAGAAVPAPTTATEVALGSTAAASGSRRICRRSTTRTRILRDLSRRCRSIPTLARLLATKGIVRGLTLAVVQIGDGKTPATPLAVAAAARAACSIVGSPSGRVDPVTLHALGQRRRRAGLGEPGGRGAALRQRQAAVRRGLSASSAIPNGDFDEAIVRAIRMLDATPNIAGDPTLRRAIELLRARRSVAALTPAGPEAAPADRAGPSPARHAWLKQLAANLDLKID